MKKVFYNTDPQQVAEKLAQVVAQASFDFWEDPEFRKMVKFSTLPKLEQDRIFNELEVTLLGLVALHAQQQPLLLELERNAVQSFLQLLSSVGVENEFVETWKLLIKQRFKEYKSDYKIAIKEAKSWEDLKDRDQLRPIWARVETLTIDCLRHIRRGKIDKGDPLWNYIRRWLTMLEVVFTKTMQESIGKIKIGIC